MWILEKCGRGLARYLSRPVETVPGATCPPETLQRALHKGDVLLVEGNTRISAAIKYLTQSSWSHAALYLGNTLDPDPTDPEARVMLEADVNEGVRAVPLSTYWERHTRICRPVGLTEQEIEAVVAHALTHLGHQYDLKNITDLARYLIPPPPMPSKYRRKILAMGSGEPTRAICSSLIAEAFQSIPYPILPYIDVVESQSGVHEWLTVRHHSLFAPRDFDVSPYFKIVKPTLEAGFDPHALEWRGEAPQPPPNAV